MREGESGAVDVARLRRHVDAFRLRNGIPAVAVRIRRASKPIFDYDSGLACLNRRMPAGAKTHFAIGSITKQFVAATALALHSRGDIDIAMPVRDMLASSQVGEHVTLSHLLSHTSGIFHDVGAAPEPSPTLASVLSRISADARAPGWWSYCNTNFYLAGQALQLVMGVPLAELVAEIIPEDLRASFRLDDAPPPSYRATGHAPTANGVGTVAPPDGRSFGSGSGFATAGMLVDWVSRLWSGKILNAESIERMSRRTVLSNGAESDYGMGCFSTRGSLVELSHDGNTAGFSNQLAYYPESQLAICVLTNSAQHVAEELEKSLRGIVLGLSEYPERPESTEPPSLLDDLAGWYGAGNHRTRVVLSEKGLRLVAPSGRVVLLMRKHGNTFAEQVTNGYEYDFAFSGDCRELKIRRGQKLLAALPRQA